jgi:hypothetical protein
VGLSGCHTVECLGVACVLAKCVLAFECFAPFTLSMAEQYNLKDDESGLRGGLNEIKGLGTDGFTTSNFCS